MCNGKMRAERAARDWGSHLKCFKEIFGEAVHIPQSGISCRDPGAYLSVRDGAHESEGLRRHLIVNIISHLLKYRFKTKKEIMQ